MVRVLLLSAGGRGDVEPYCAIVKALLSGCPRSSASKATFSDSNPVFVDFFVQSDYQDLVQPFERHPSFRVFPFPFTGDDFYRAIQDDTYASVHSSQRSSDPRMVNAVKLSTIISRVILPCMDQVVNVLDSHGLNEKCIIITSAYTRSLALLLAQNRTNVRVIVLHLQPLLPNQLFPSYRTQRGEFVRRCILLTSGDEGHVDSQRLEVNLEYEDSYWMIEEVVEGGLIPNRLTEICEHVPEGCCSPYNFEELQTMLTGRHPRVWVVNAYSNQLIPKLEGDARLGPNVVDVGPLGDDYVPYGHERLEPRIQEFLSCEEKPICVGFGSMPFRNIGAVLEACKQLKIRAVLVGTVFEQIPEEHPARRFGRVICVSTAPYPLLLPQCSMMLCHGGSGVVHSCLRAGIPCLVSPLMGDQFAWAALFEGKGLGVQCGSRLSEITAKDIIDAIKVGQDIFVHCKRISASIRNNHSTPVGGHAIVDLIQNLSSS